MNDSHPNPLARSATCHHYTPPDLDDRARFALGGEIELDPFSCATANRLVRARRIFTARDNGFRRPWNAETALVNPPSGRVGNVSAPRAAWEKLCEEWLAERLRRAIFVVFNLGQLQSLQADARLPSPLGFVACVPAARIRYFTRKKPAKMSLAQKEQWARWGLCEGDAPMHGGAIVGVGVDRALFVEAFGELGSITVPLVTH